MRQVFAGIFTVLVMLYGQRDPHTNALAQVDTDAADEPDAQESPLKSTDRSVPDDVVSLLQWAGGGDGPFQCVFRQADRLEMPHPDLSDVWVPCDLAVNDVFVQPWIDRSLGWPAGRVQFEVRQPDGSIFPPFSDDPNRFQEWPIDPGSALGQYTVTGHLGDRTAVGTLEVLPRVDLPIIRVRAYRGRDGTSVSESPNLTGTSFRVTLAGFDPGQDVKLVLYRGSQSFGYNFHAVIATVQMDERGESSYLLSTAADDPPGGYAIQTVPESRGIHYPAFQGARFCITEMRDWLECSAGQSLDDLARNVVLEAKRTLATAMDQDGAADLHCAFDGDALARVRAQLRDLRASEQYVDARLRGPIRVNSAWITSETDGGEIDEFEAHVNESWDARLHQSDGSLIEDLAGNREWHYRIVRRITYRDPAAASGPLTPKCGTGWSIVEAELLNPE